MTITQIHIKFCELWQEFRAAKADGEDDTILEGIRDDIRELKNKLAYLQKKANLTDYLA